MNGYRMFVCAVSVAGWMLLCPAAGVRGDEPADLLTSDIVYRSAGGQDLKLDIITPQPGSAVAPYPAVVFIHGGGWSGGNKKDMHPFMKEFAKAGYVTISVQYRLCPKDRFPAQIHDVKAAVRWVRENAAKYQIDPDRIGAMGGSAGGHLALMLGVTDPEDGLEGLETSSDAQDQGKGDAKKAVSSRVQAVVNFVGPTDLGAADIPPTSVPIVKNFLGVTAKEDPKLAAKASPLTYVTRDDPPMLTFQGTRDVLVPYTQAYALAQAMDRVGIPGRVEILVGAGHGWAGPEMQRTVAQSLNFCNIQLKHTPAVKP